MFLTLMREDLYGGYCILSLAIVWALSPVIFFFFYAKIILPKLKPDANYGFL